MNTLKIQVKKPTYLPWLIYKINKCTKKKNQNYADNDNLLNGEPEFGNFYTFVLEYCNIDNLTGPEKQCFYKMVVENWIKQNDVSIL